MTDLEEKHLKTLLLFEDTGWANPHLLGITDQHDFSELANLLSQLISGPYHYLLCNHDDYQIQPRGRNRLNELKEKKEKEQRKELVEEEKSELDLEIKRLQKDEFGYKKTIRDQEDELRQLRIDNETFTWFEKHGKLFATVLTVVVATITALTEHKFHLITWILSLFQ